MTEDELIAVIQVDRRVLTVWVESGWLRPEGGAGARRFTELDLARARLISDLEGPMGVNAEGIDIILDLLDQMHGLRAAMRSLGQTLETQPEPLRHRLRAEIRRAGGHVREL